MNLFIDIGNTAVKFGVESKEENLLLLKVISTSDVIKNNIDFSFLPDMIDKAYASSVVPKAFDYLDEIIFQKYQCHIKRTPVSNEYGVKIDMDNPNELGDDLFFDLVAAVDLYQAPLLIVDLGTANKLLFIDKNNTFKSAQIFMGLDMSLSMLAKNTALLPQLSFEKIKPILECTNTHDVLTTSAYHSQLDTINGGVKRYFQEIGSKVPVIVTGGNIDIFKNDLDFDYQYHQNLCLYGLEVISEKERKQ